MRSWRYLLLLSTLWSAGCQSYRPKPIDSQPVDRDLAVPARDVLREQACDIHHPLLQPIELDLRDGLSPDEAAILASPFPTAAH